MVPPNFSTVSSTSVTLPLAAQTMGCGFPVGTLVGAVVGAFFGGPCFGAVLLYNAAPLWSHWFFVIKDDTGQLLS